VSLHNLKIEPSNRFTGGELGTDGEMITLICILKEQIIKMWSGFKWWTRVITTMNIRQSRNANSFIKCLKGYISYFYCKLLILLAKLAVPLPNSLIYLLLHIHYPQFCILHNFITINMKSNLHIDVRTSAKCCYLMKILWVSQRLLRKYTNRVTCLRELLLMINNTEFCLHKTEINFFFNFPVFRRKTNIRIAYFTYYINNACYLWDDIQQNMFSVPRQHRSNIIAV
jgi:hypothetical protein